MKKETSEIFPVLIVGIVAIVAILGMVIFSGSNAFKGFDTNKAGSATYTSRPDLSASDSLSGELDVVIAEDLKGNYEYNYYIKTQPNAKGIKLNMDKKATPRFKSGDRVAVKGKLSTGAEALSLSSIDLVSTATAEALAVNNPRKAVVILVASPTSPSLATADQIINTMYTGQVSVDSFYKKASYDQVSWVSDANGDGKADVFGPFVVNSTFSNCDDYYIWASLADSAASQAGVNLNLYQHRIYVFPSGTSCSWAGRANLGCGSYCSVWLTYTDTFVFIHELGHNLGMHHASTDPENDGAINSEYGDWSCPMGNAWSISDFNAPHLFQEGWLSNIDSSKIVSTASGTYNLYALSLDPRTVPSPMILKIPKTDTSEYYFVSYRNNEGLDTTLSTSYQDGASIHVYYGSGGSQTKIITKLNTGGEFTDAKNNLRITQLAKSADNKYITVKIENLNAPPSNCTPAAPTISISPASQVGNSGQSLSYSISVKNNDGTQCSASNFSITSTMSTGLSQTPASFILTLSPGSQGSRSVSVTSTGGSGTYTFQEKAQNLGSGLSSTANGQYIVNEAVCTRGAPTVSITPSDQSGNPGALLTYTVSVTNTDNAACVGSNFSITSSMPTGVIQSPNSFVIYVPAGSTVSQSINVNSTNLEGTYSFSNQAQNLESGMTGTGYATYTMNAICNRVNPLLSLSPALQSGTPGVSNTFTLSVTNQDSSTCALSKFSVSSVLPAGFVQSPASFNTSLLPGGSSSRTLTVTPAANTALGQYTFTETAVNTAANQYSTSIMGKYDVIQGCIRSAPIVTIVPSSQNTTISVGQAYTVFVTNNDNGACGNSTFAVARVSTSYLSFLPSSSNLIISPGSSRSKVITVTPSSSTPSGRYPFTIKATNSKDTSFVSNASAEIVVKRPDDTTPPIVTINGPMNNTLFARTRVSFSFSASAQDDNMISQMRLYLDSTLLKICTAKTICSTSVNVTNVNGMHTLTAIAVDGSDSANSASASVVFTKLT